MPVTPETFLPTWFEDLWNAGDEATIDRMMHEDAVIHGLSGADGPTMRGRTKFKDFYQVFKRAFPDVRIEVLHVLCDGELTVAHCRVVGTHRGDQLGFRATNKPIEIQGFTLARIVDGRLVEGWNCFDFMTLYTQIGASVTPPAPPPAGA